MNSWQSSFLNLNAVIIGLSCHTSSELGMCVCLVFIDNRILLKMLVIVLMSLFKNLSKG